MKTRLKVRVVRRSSAISSHRSLLARSYSIVALVTFNCFDRIEHRVYAGLAFNLPSCLCIVYWFVLGHRYTQELVELSGYCFFLRFFFYRCWPCWSNFGCTSYRLFWQMRHCVGLKFKKISRKRRIVFEENIVFPSEKIKARDRKNRKVEIFYNYKITETRSRRWTFTYYSTI